MNFGRKNKQKGHWFIPRRRTHNSKKLQQIKNKTWKDIIRIFKQIGFIIEIKTNLKEVDFLNVTFSLKKETYQPFRKENNTLLYIHTYSNHPPPIIKQIPESILDYLPTLPTKPSLTLQKENMRQH